MLPVSLPAPLGLCLLRIRTSSRRSWTGRPPALRTAGFLARFVPGRASPRTTPGEQPGQHGVFAKVPPARLGLPQCLALDHGERRWGSCQLPCPNFPQGLEPTIWGGGQERPETLGRGAGNEEKRPVALAGGSGVWASCTRRVTEPAKEAVPPPLTVERRPSFVHPGRSCFGKR